MGSSEVTVATTGSVDRDDKCATCDGPMLYRVMQPGEVVVGMFCGFQPCAAWLLEIPMDGMTAPRRLGPRSQSWRGSRSSAWGRKKRRRRS
jgi:hypothetical protein